MTNKPVIRSIFFGNYFYGICAVALSMEAAVQQGIPVNEPAYYWIVFSLCTWFYTRAYVQDQNPENLNQRTQWYRHHARLVHVSQASLLTSGSALLLWSIPQLRFDIGWQNWFLLLCFPAAAFLYYGPQLGSRFSLNLRNRGWLKPFLIGFIWAGAVTVYPLFYYYMQQGMQPVATSITLLLFTKNFVFISILCIMFDIKDYAEDYNRELKTFVVRNGLRKTIFMLLIPLCIIGLASLVVIGIFRGFTPVRIGINTLPFWAAMLMAYSLHKRHQILYYLVLIDGLMLFKAFCGIIAMWF
ncbi:MAG: hypothetical protein QM743_10905 [Chitinophagaceae bacterium]